MVSSLQERALALRAKAKRPATPKERAEEARQRILKAAANLPGAVSGYVGRRPLSAVGLALLSGFVIGYWPGADRALVRNLDGLLRFLYNLRL